MSQLPNSRVLHEENLSGSSESFLAKKYNTTRAVIHGRIYNYRRSNKTRQNGLSSTQTINHNDQESVTSNIEKNNAEIQSKSRTIRTLDKLLSVGNVDLDVWEVTRHVINKWDVTNSEGTTFENWQVKAWLARIEPIEIYPDVTPVIINLSPQKPRSAPIINDATKDAITRIMYLTDPHFGYDKDTVSHELRPYHNETNLEIALSVFSSNNFDYLIWGGDILDCNEWSTHFIKMPEFRQTTQPAINSAAQWIARFHSENPDARHVVIRGNHDDRLNDYIISNLSEAYRLVPGDDPDAEPLMSVSNLLGLRHLGVDYVDEISFGDTVFIHGDIARSGGGMTAKAHLEKKSINTVFGHVHRREIASEVIIGHDGKKEIFALCPGCLCYTDGRLPGSDNKNNWQNGFAVLEFDDTKTCISSEIINIVNKKAVYNGKIYS